MKSPVQILVDKRNEIQSEYNRVLKVYPHETGNLKFNESFKWGKKIDLADIKRLILQYDQAIFTLKNSHK